MEYISSRMFRSELKLDNGSVLPILSLGPVCIKPAFQRQGYGKILLERAFAKASELGYGAIFFEGDIAFYGKCGCVPAACYAVRYQGLPEGTDASFFLCKLLKEGYLDGRKGEYSDPTVYCVSDEEAAAFDAGFPHRE